VQLTEAGSDFAPKDHPLTDQGTVSVQDVADAGLITAPMTSRESPFYDHVLLECGIPPGRSVLENDGLQSRLLAAEAGLGVVGTFIPPYARDAAPGPLVALPVEGPSASVEVGLVRRRGEPPAGGVLRRAGPPGRAPPRRSGRRG
jgi:DNA-binding transcriptional LysR family regulator